MNGVEHFYFEASPADFLWNIANCKFVITDSYHGALFAVLYKKPFITGVIRGVRRFDTLVELGLGNRIKKRSQIGSFTFDVNVNWDLVYNELQKRREDSFKWLANAFGRDLQPYQTRYNAANSRVEILRSEIRIDRVDKLDNELCTGCECCVNVCPCKCVSMVLDSEGISYPAVESEKCTACGICAIRCPVLK